jgi:hypothetical protein
MFANSIPLPLSNRYVTSQSVNLDLLQPLDQQANPFSDYFAIINSRASSGLMDEDST